jgi:hypothetical protein
MRQKRWLSVLSATAFLMGGACCYGQDTSAKQGKAPTSPSASAKESTTGAAVAAGPETAAPEVSENAVFIDAMAARGFKKSTTAAPVRGSTVRGKGSGASAVAAVASGENHESFGALPLWTFRLQAARDDQLYSGAMVGRNPFTNPGKASVPTVVIPLIIKTTQVATAFDPMTGIFTEAPGDTTLNPNAADTTCLSAPNDVPSIVVKQSPIFTPAKFVMGGTYVGTTEYNDAFQRANFWNVLGEDRDIYHVKLDSQFISPITLNVPDVYGLAITNGLLLGPPAFCAPLGIVDINWFDTYLTGTVIPELQEHGIVNPGVFPVFLVYNVVWASPVTNLGTCCIGGYHSITGFPIPTQTYSPADFDYTGFFVNAAGQPTPLDTSILAHEVDEWMDDPYVSNPTPPWGNTGQVVGCQANLEVGDPLTGNNIPAITMPNGFTYHLQELAFFPWFFGGKSFSVNGWYSDNGTFTTDAGPPCH